MDTKEAENILRKCEELKKQYMKDYDVFSYWTEVIYLTEKFINSLPEPVQDLILLNKEVSQDLKNAEDS